MDVTSRTCTTQGSVRPVRGGRKAPAPWGGGTGAARRAGAPGGNLTDAYCIAAGGSGAKRDAGIPRALSTVAYNETKRCPCFDRSRLYRGHQ